MRAPRTLGGLLALVGALVAVPLTLWLLTAPLLAAGLLAAVVLALGVRTVGPGLTRRVTDPSSGLPAPDPSDC